MAARLIEEKSGERPVYETFRLGDAIERLPALVAGKPFTQQMERFIDSETILATLAKPGFLDYLTKTVGGLLGNLALHVKSGPDAKPEPVFKM